MDVSAIDAEDLRILCVTRALDEETRVACLDLVEHGLLPTLGLAPPAPPDNDPTATVPAEAGPYDIGEWITVQEDGADVLRLKVTKVKPSKSVRADGIVWKPERRGNVFVSAFFRYEALTDEAIVSPVEWRAYTDGEAAPVWCALGMKPDLQDGVLSEGRTASGWVTFEVPKRGQVVIERDTFGGQTPVEIVLRDR